MNKNITKNILLYFNRYISNRNILFAPTVLIGILLGLASLLVFAAVLFLTYLAVKKAMQFKYGDQMKQKEGEKKVHEYNKNNGKQLTEEDDKKEKKEETNNKEVGNKATTPHTKYFDQKQNNNEKIDQNNNSSPEKIQPTINKKNDNTPTIENSTTKQTSNEQHKENHLLDNNKQQLINLDSNNKAKNKQNGFSLS